MTAANIARAPAEARRIDTGFLIWLAAIAFALLCLVLRQSVALDRGISAELDPAHRHRDQRLHRLVRQHLPALLPGHQLWPRQADARPSQAVLQWLPWPAVMLLVGVTALRAGGWKLALFAVASLAYLVIVGYWTQSMNTLALVILAVPLSVVIGFALGVLADRVPKAMRRHRGRARHDADHARLRLSDPAAAALRLRAGGRADRERDLCHPAHGAQHAARAAAGAAGDQGIRHR